MNKGMSNDFGVWSHDEMKSKGNEIGTACLKKIERKQRDMSPTSIILWASMHNNSFFTI